MRLTQMLLFMLALLSPLARALGAKGLASLADRNKNPAEALLLEPSGPALLYGGEPRGPVLRRFARAICDGLLITSLVLR